MAAAYQNGGATSPTNLLQTLETWLVAQGWTVDLSAVDGINGGRRLHVHKGAVYVNLRSAHDERIFGYVNDGSTISYVDWDPGYGIGLYLGTGFDSGDAWWDQLGGPKATRTDSLDDKVTVGVGMNLPTGAISGYHFFDDGADHVVVVVEKTPGIFVHMGWGPDLEGAGNPEAFPFFFGSSPSAYVTDNTGVAGPGLTLTAHAPFAHSFIHSLYVDGTAFVRVDATTFTSRWISNSGAPANPVPDAAYGWTGRDGRCAVNQSTQTSGLDEGEYVAWRWLKDRAHQSAQVAALPLPLHFHVIVEPAARWAHVGWPPTVFYSTAVGHGFSPVEVYPIGGQDYMVFPNFVVRKDA